MTPPSGRADGGESTPRAVPDREAVPARALADDSGARGDRLRAPAAPSGPRPSPLETPAAPRISAGQFSDAGRKPTNQDFHAVCVPAQPQLAAKGIAVAIADGISSSDVSQVASRCAVTAFLADYYCTPESWSVKTSAERVLRATNSWLESQTRRGPHRYERDRGHVCTFSALVIKGRTAHLFHVGDARIYRVRGRDIEQLTNDHRVWIGDGQSYLGRALGVNSQLEIDYQALAVDPGDVFVLATDGVHEHVGDAAIAEAVAAHTDDLDDAARHVAGLAHAHGSQDNLTVQVVRIESLPDADAGEHRRHLAELPFPPMLEPRMAFDGYRIVRELHASNRSHIHLALDEATNETVAIKTPSIDLRGNPAYLESFLLEEWIARRIDSPNVLKPCAPTRARSYLYVCFEFVEGQTLAQWMLDHPRPTLEAVRGIVEQIAKGLRAFHRLEMVHRDVRPHNVMIDRTGTVRIIDFGSTRVAGISEGGAPSEPAAAGTAQYAAPECLLGESGSPRSDLFSLGVIAYQMLTGRLPYGAGMARARSRADQNKLAYRSALEHNRELPVWIDGVLRKALHVDPLRRYADPAEFVHDLRHPDQEFLQRSRPPLIERNPLAFWQGVSLVLLVVVIALLAFRPA